MAVKFCVVGCGALGGVIAAHLARLKDVEVYAYDISGWCPRAAESRDLATGEGAGTLPERSFVIIRRRRVRMRERGFGMREEQVTGYWFWILVPSTLTRKST